MSQAYDELATVAADIVAHLEWAQMLGSEVLPRERFERVAGPPIRKSAATPSASPAVQPRQPTPRPRPSPRQQPPPVAPKPTASTAAPVEQRATASAALSSKWAKVMEGPSTHTVTGPKRAKVMVVRGAGSSSDAESMLERMMTNVVGLGRGEVAMVDVVRADHSRDELAKGLRGLLQEYTPALVLVMGVHAVRSLVSESGSVDSARGDWLTAVWPGGECPMRVTHHPEAIIAMAARGQTDAKREAFDDLKAIRERLS